MYVLFIKILIISSIWYINVLYHYFTSDPMKSAIDADYPVPEEGQEGSSSEGLHVLARIIARSINRAKAVRPSTGNLSDDMKADLPGCSGPKVSQ